MAQTTNPRISSRRLSEHVSKCVCGDRNHKRCQSTNSTEEQLRRLLPSGSIAFLSIPADVRPSQSHVHQRCKEHGLMHQSQRIYVEILPRPTVPGRSDGPARDLCPSCFQPQVSVQQNCIDLRAVLCVAGSGRV